MKKLLKSVKGFQLNQVPSIVIVLLVVAVVLGVGLTVLTQVQDTQTSGSLAYNATQEGMDGLTDLSEWQTTWAVIVAAAIVIGIISAYLFFGNK